LGKVCVGGLYDGRPANALEDAQACVENEGHIVDDGSCGFTSIAPMMFNQPLSVGAKAAVTSLMLLPLRLVRDAVPTSPLVMGLEAVSDRLSNDVERLAGKHPEIQEMLVPRHRGFDSLMSA
jgi:hypothetical protein